ncbi:MAG: ChaN family lipoprotein [Gammaproteobacteria bacterium]|nr:ChaN family lipoprotein [Gammaproteobacteria bacterium]MDD9896042.1 ChaN family lipoprotein [Gammaproteobacteria bacterium]MDD9957684.1 ChaN family lipoprotein [Gammaproteobacteria bacterium]
MEPIRLLGITLVFVIPFCAHAQLSTPTEWESQLYTDHSLVGRIWDSSVDSFITAGELSNAAREATYLILGEKHDNPDHHRLQLEFINLLLDAAALRHISFEMLDTDSQALLNQMPDQQLESLHELREYLAWDEEGWDWNFYGPLLQAAYSADVPMAAGNITNARIGEVYGLDSLPIEFDVLDSATVDQLFVDIDESHCGLLPESQFPAMVRVQQARDYSMAQSMAEPGADGVTVLITGNYHARQDLGVPNYLLASQINVSLDDIVSIGLMEVQAGEEDPRAYLQQYGEIAAYDYIWFTPVVSEEDYCASLRQ